MTEKNNNLTDKFTVDEIIVSYGTTIKLGREEWRRIDYSAKLRIKDQESIALAKLCAQGLVEGWVKQFVNDQRVKMHVKISDINMDKIKWHNSRGERGPFERSVDKQNPEYQKLYHFLLKPRSADINGYFVWLFEKDDAIGRKPL